VETIFITLRDRLSLYSATQYLGIANQVTTLTASEFGRTLQPSGSGCDYGWGNHHLVLGGAENGGDLYGNYPDGYRRAV
jgi:uncharacterized protein (DUF1501 family)